MRGSGDSLNETLGVLSTFTAKYAETMAKTHNGTMMTLSARSVWFPNHFLRMQYTAATLAIIEAA